VLGGWLSVWLDCLEGFTGGAAAADLFVRLQLCAQGPQVRFIVMRFIDMRIIDIG